MNRKDFEKIKDYHLNLKIGEKSPELVLEDPGNETMYFTFELRYVDNITLGKTSLSATDSFHAEFIIETTPNAITKPNEYIEIGTYGSDEKNLFIDFTVQPEISNTREHEITITFYTKK